MSTIVWFRLDLRLADNPALHAAVERGRPIVPVFIWSPDEEGAWAPGAASRWWLHQSLKSFDASLRELGSRLILRRGPSLPSLRELVKETGADSVFWNRRYEPALIARDTEIKKTLQADGLQVESFNSALLFEPWEIKNSTGKPFQVFTPFWRACLSRSATPGGVADKSAVAGRVPPRGTSSTLLAPSLWPKSLPLASLELEPKLDWASGMRAAWKPGEAGAKEQFDRFLKEAVTEYPQGRDRPDLAGTSRLSPHLHFGEISPRQIWERCSRARRARHQASDSFSAYLRQLGWREFAHHLLYHFPHTPDAPLRSEFARFPWTKDPKALKAWQRGRTGYPLVDAGMRELWTTGWMHNRVRMVVASLLVKDLLLPWQEGARWFWDTLVDADLANNTLGWQWVAGCGADAAPFFRIFNPVNQGEKFDPNGDYVRRWCPELARLPAPWIRKPWEAPPAVLQDAGVALDRTYPKPIIRHAIARMRALATYKSVRAAARTASPL
jgi:deoxyribodipyrimidine photo-lyase